MRHLIIHPNGRDFMQLVENYYKDWVASNEWMILDEDQETILALKAQILIKKKAMLNLKAKEKTKTKVKKKEIKKDLSG